jgi:hypothetical protein
MTAIEHFDGKILSLADLQKCVDEKRAVFCPALQPFRARHIPAAFIMQMSGKTIHQLIKTGLYIYLKTEGK